MTALAVSTEGLTKRFGDRTVVDGLALAVPSGSVCGFVGPNGAGKTTTIRMLLGLVDPTSGSGRVLGGSLDDPASYLGRVGALIEAPAFYPQLSGRDNLRALTRLARLPATVIDPVLDRVGLLHRAGDRYRTYSLGMKQRLGIAASLLPGPQLLVLDEPTNGLDPAGIVEMRGLIRSLAGDGITVVVSSHLIAEIDHICDHVVVIRAGRLVHQGPATELRAAQGTELAVRPEHGADTPRLLALLEGTGLCARMDPQGEDVVVTGGASPTTTGATAAAAAATAGPGPGAAGTAARVNRLAMDHGIVLVQLAERRRTLEDAFFALTGTGSADVEAAGDLGEVA